MEKDKPIRDETLQSTDDRRSRGSGSDQLHSPEKHTRELRRRASTAKMVLKELWRDICITLHIPLQAALFTADVAIVIPCAILFGAFSFGLIGVIGAVVLSQAPIEYKVYQKIKRENTLAKVLTEGYESNGKPLAQTVQEYKDLLKRNHKSHD